MQVQRGCDGPKLTRLIVDYLKKEHAVLDGSLERQVVSSIVVWLL